MTSLEYYCYTLILLSVICTICEYSVNENWQILRIGPRMLLSILINFIHHVFFLFTSTVLFFCAFEYITKKKRYVELLRISMILIMLSVIGWLAFDNHCFVTLIQNKLDENAHTRPFLSLPDFFMKKRVSSSNFYFYTYLCLNGLVLFDFWTNRQSDNR